MPLPITLYSTDAPQSATGLLRMAFGATEADAAIAHPGLPLLSHSTVIETWGTDTAARRGKHGSIHWATDDYCLVGHIAMPIEGDAAPITHALYRELLGFVADSAFPHLLRVWHYLPRINDGSGDQELYRRFSVGRAQAFDEFPRPDDELPAGTAIGTRSGNTLLVYFVASRTAGRQIENPRQVSAFDYPRQYGPRKPLFSRATAWADERGVQLLVSGTASIVGHASRHWDDLDAQLAETWRNLESLRQTAGATQPIILRVYVRNEADYPAIRDFLDARLDANVATLYLLADICRAELLLEIEGVYAMPATDGELSELEAPNEQ